MCECVCERVTCIGVCGCECMSVWVCARECGCVCL